mmetsp:Transcript_23797/g.38211  ORF Transcript_23797/g.38211 Transcript_23797/m.38211 type:complete len:212 (-) Transcript_23797:684-1319(-)
MSREPSRHLLPPPPPPPPPNPLPPNPPPPNPPPPSPPASPPPIIAINIIGSIPPLLQDFLLFCSRSSSFLCSSSCFFIARSLSSSAFFKAALLSSFAFCRAALFSFSALMRARRLAFLSSSMSFSCFLADSAALALDIFNLFLKSSASFSARSLRERTFFTSKQANGSMASASSFTLRISSLYGRASSSSHLSYSQSKKNDGKSRVLPNIS